jgi:hypothetical protein
MGSYKRNEIRTTFTSISRTLLCFVEIVPPLPTMAVGDRGRPPRPPYRGSLNLLPLEALRFPLLSTRENAVRSWNCTGPSANLSKCFFFGKFPFTPIFTHFLLSVKTIFDLPRVVVIGGQSSKSFAMIVFDISGRSGCCRWKELPGRGCQRCTSTSIAFSFTFLTILFQINVPRDSGTCTR